MDKKIMGYYADHAEEGVRSAGHPNVGTYRRRVFGVFDLVWRMALDKRGLSIAQADKISVLDLGCGAGQSIPYFCWVDRYIGVDVVPEVVRQAQMVRARYPGLVGEIKQGDAGDVMLIPELLESNGGKKFDLGLSLSVMTSGPEERWSIKHAHVLHSLTKWFVVSWNDASVVYGGFFKTHTFDEIVKIFGEPVGIKVLRYAHGVDPMVAALFKSWSVR